MVEDMQRWATNCLSLKLKLNTNLTSNDGYKVTKNSQIQPSINFFSGEVDFSELPFEETNYLELQIYERKLTFWTFLMPTQNN